MESISQTYSVQGTPITRKSVNWARKRPPSDEGSTAQDDSDDDATSLHHNITFGRAYEECQEDPNCPSPPSLDLDAASSVGGGMYSAYDTRPSSRMSQAPLSRMDSAISSFRGLEALGPRRTVRLNSAATTFTVPSTAASTLASRPGTSDTHGASAPPSPSTVGLSARQRAMMEAAHRGTFRFARIKRPVAASGSGSCTAAGSQTGEELPTAGTGPAGGGGGERASPSMRVTGAVVMAATALQSPIASYRRVSPPVPAANHRPSFASSGSTLTAAAAAAAGGGGGGGGGLPSQASFSTLSSTQAGDPHATVVAAAPMVRQEREASSAAMSTVRRPSALVFDSYPAYLGTNNTRGGGGGGVTRTEVVANFVRPGRAAVQQPGLAKHSQALDASEDGSGGSGDPWDPAELVDAELGPLLREMAEINVRPSVRAALSKLDERSIKKLFSATSRRVDNLPCTPLVLSSGGGLLLPLPGPKGVPGFRVNKLGQVMPTKKSRRHFYSKPDGKAGGGGGGAHSPRKSSTAPDMPMLVTYNSSPLALSEIEVHDKVHRLLADHGPRGTLELFEERERSAGPATPIAAGTASGIGRPGSPQSGAAGRRGGMMRSVSLARRRSGTNETQQQQQQRRSGNGGPIGSGGGSGGPGPGSPPPSPQLSFSRPGVPPGVTQLPNVSSQSQLNAQQQQQAVPGQGTAPAGVGAGRATYPDARFGVSLMSAATAAAAAGAGSGAVLPLTPDASSLMAAPSVFGVPSEATLGPGPLTASGASGGGQYSSRHSPRHEMRVKLARSVGAGGDGGGLESGGMGGAGGMSWRGGGGGGGVWVGGGGGGGGVEYVVSDPLEARRWRLGRLMAQLEDEEVPDELLLSYMPRKGSNHPEVADHNPLTATTTAAANPTTTTTTITATSTISNTVAAAAAAFMAAGALSPVSSTAISAAAIPTTSTDRRTNSATVTAASGDNFLPSSRHSIAISSVRMTNAGAATDGVAIPPGTASTSSSAVVEQLASTSSSHVQLQQLVAPFAGSSGTSMGGVVGAGGTGGGGPASPSAADAATVVATAAVAAAAAAAEEAAAVWGWAGRAGGLDDSEEEVEDEEDRAVANEELGLLTLDQTLAVGAVLGATPAPDALFAALEHGVKRRAALAERRALREEEARRRAEEEASRYIEVPLGSEDPQDELVGLLRAGLRGAVLRMRRHGETGRESMLHQSGFLHNWPTSKARHDPPPRPPSGPSPEPPDPPPGRRHLRFLAHHRTLPATTTSTGSSQPHAPIHTQHLSMAAERAASAASAHIHTPSASRSLSPYTHHYGSTPTPHTTTPVHSLHHHSHDGFSSVAIAAAAVAAAAGAAASGSGSHIGGRSMSPRHTSRPDTAAAQGKTSWSPHTQVHPHPHSHSHPHSHFHTHIHHTGGPRQRSSDGDAVRGNLSSASSAPYEYENEEQRARLEPVLGGWQRVAEGDSQLAALGAFKEALQPASSRLQPPDMKPFAPVEGEPVKVTEAQVSRRLAQATETGTTTLDVDFGPRLTRGDFAAVYSAMKLLAPAAVLCLRAVDGVMTATGVDGLAALVRARPGIEQLELRGNPALGPAAASRLAPLLHPTSRCRVTRLDLSGCPLGEGGFSALAGQMAENRHLQILHVSGCGLGDGALTPLYQALALNHCLRVLDLANNRFSEHGITVLCKDLEDNRSLTRLDLSHCSLPDEAAGPIARLLAVHPALTSLDLSHNCLGWLGGRALVEGLKPQPQQPQQRSQTWGGSGGGGGTGSGMISGSGGGRGMNPQRPVLQELKLDGNPLGQAGVLALMRLLQVNSTLSRVSLANVTLTQRPGEPLELDPQHPNGHYVLNLAEPEDRKAATTLMSLWHSSGGSSWLSATLNDAPLHMPRAAAGCVTPSGTGAWPPWVRPHLRWPEAMPATGTLTVTIRNNASLDPAILTAPPPPPLAPATPQHTHTHTPHAGPSPSATSVATTATTTGKRATASSVRVTSTSGISVVHEDAAGAGGTAADSGGAAALPAPPITLSPSLMNCLLGAVGSPAGGEIWKAQLLKLATKVAFVTAEQAGQLLAGLRYRAERADAGAALLSATPDLHRAPWALRAYAKFGPDDMAELLQELSLAPLLPLRSRVVNGWDSCCSGKIRLDLAQQSHRLLAVLLVQVAHRDGGGPAWATPQAAPPEEDLYGAATARLGDATSCMRDITFAGRPLGHSVMYLSSANLPTQGIIETYFVNLRPRSHVVYPGLGQGRERRKAPDVVSGKSLAVNPNLGAPLSSSPTPTNANLAHALSNTSLTIAAPSSSSTSTTSTTDGSLHPTPSRAPSPAPGTLTPTASAPSSSLPSRTILSGLSVTVKRPTPSSSQQLTISTAASASQQSLTATLPGSGLSHSLPSSQQLPQQMSQQLPQSSGTNAGSGGTGGVAASVVAMETMRFAASAFTSSVAINAVLNKRNWWQQYQGAWEGVFVEGLLRLGLQHNQPGLAGWKVAPNMWKGQYRVFSSRLHSEIRQRQGGYMSLGASKRRSTYGGEVEGGAGEGAGGKKGGGGKKGKGKKAADADADDSSKPAATAAAGKQADKKGAAAGSTGRKGGGGKKGGGKKGEGEGAGGGPWGPNVDPVTVRLLAGLEARARQLAPLMVEMACGVSLSVYQVLYLLRLLPDLDLRVKVLVALWPAIWDRGNVIDLILDLDHPVVLPPPGARRPGESPPLPTLVAAGGPQDPRRSTATGTTSPVPPSTALPRSPNVDPGPIRPRGFVPSPHVGDELLLKVAACLGWRSLLVCWAAPGALSGRTLHLHMGAIDQLQAVSSICRFADRCYRATGHQPVTGLACDGVAVDPGAAAELRGGIWQLILSRTVLCLDRHEYGTVSLQLDGITADAQRVVAAVTIQAVWRGYRVRREMYNRATVLAGGNRWRRVLGAVILSRRLAVMRTLAADLDISRAQSEMERGYLRMLYGPNAA